MNYLEKIATSLNCSVSELITGYVKAPKKYKIFFIKKKNSNKLREVAQPAADVKKVQRAIVASILKDLPIHSCAKAYIDETSIFDNAVEHKENTYLLKMDFKDFFPSIKPDDLYFYLIKNKIELNSFEYTILKNYLFWKKKGEKELRLCIGAPSSPIISNIVMYNIDCQLSEYCIDRNIPYTRYADDLTFSSNNIEDLRLVREYVLDTLSGTISPKLFVNEKKTKLVGKGRSRRITGVVITNDGELGVGRYLRKKVKALVHLYNNDSINKSDIPYLQGMLSHIKNIEPAYYEKIHNKYNENLFIRLGKDSARIIEMKKSTKS